MNIFGSVHLGYVVIDTEKFAEWRRFGRDAIGMHLDETLPDVMRFRLDDHQCRFLVRRGPAEDVSALGWQIDDHQHVRRDPHPGYPPRRAGHRRAPPRRPSCAASNGWSGSPAPTA